jgi:SAM-dependent methyltransferase
MHRTILSAVLIIVLVSACVVGRDVRYQPSPEQVVEGMLDMGKVGSNDYVIDLGSGDGRIPIAAGKRGARALGVEIDPALIAESRANAERAGVADRVTFRQQDLFATDVREATVVTLYLFPQINLALRPKLQQQLRPGSRIVSHNWDMGDWMPDRREVIAGKQVYLWIIPERGGRQP